MAIRQDHEIHTRRKGRNYGLGLVLAALVALIFGLSLVKISHLEEGKLPDAEAPQ